MRTRAALALAPALLLLPLLSLCACSSGPGDQVGTSGAAIGGFTGCSGLFDTHPNPTGSYYATDFGCSSNPSFTDPGDTCGSASCIQSGFSEGVCDSSQSNAECQRTVNWYSVGGAIFGCGARLQVTNPANGKSVVVMVLDNGPSCTVENDANFWVLDVSYPTIMYLFGSQEGWSDHALISAVQVDSSTPLGPTGSSPPPPGGGGGGGGGDDAGASCFVSSLGQSGSCTLVSDCAAQGGTSTPGLCPGASDVQCCTPSAGPSPAPGGGGGGASCNTDGDCNPGSSGSGEICVSGSCVAGCNADWQCPGDTTCVGGQCQ
jgi:hypothetical protein